MVVQEKGVVLIISGLRFMDSRTRRRGAQTSWPVRDFASGEMLTATAMASFQDEISRAVVVALFLPLIILFQHRVANQARRHALKTLRLCCRSKRFWDATKSFTIS
jgi:hypothetical protein